jgi:hypothetical protein
MPRESALLFPTAAATPEPAPLVVAKPAREAAPGSAGCHGSAHGASGTHGTDPCGAGSRAGDAAPCGNSRARGGTGGG